MMPAASCTNRARSSSVNTMSKEEIALVLSHIYEQYINLHEALQSHGEILIEISALQKTTNNNTTAKIDGFSQDFQL